MLVIGCGNRDRGDDGAGLMVAERLRELGVNVEMCAGESLALIEAWGRADDVILVDAVVTGARLGTVWLWDDQTAQIQRSLTTSTHGFGVAEAIQLARILDRLPKRLRLFGIEGRRFDVGGEVSPEVGRAIEELAQRIACASSERSQRTGKIGPLNIERDHYSGFSLEDTCAVR
jgi:hydrogenase maturation protease